MNNKYTFFKKYKTSNLYINKKKCDEICEVSVSIEPQFKEEMRIFINKVIGKELTFLLNYYNESGLNLIIRVNGVIVAYGRLEFPIDKNSNNNHFVSDDSIKINRICIDENYRGNKFYDTFFLLAIKFAHENNIKFISCMIGTYKVALQNKVDRFGFEKDKVYKIPIGWDNFKTTGDCLQSIYHVKNHFILNFINHLIDLSILNNVENYESYISVLKIASKL